MFPQLGTKATLLVRETYGSLGAPLLVEALPESAMILLVRDPGDVVASSLDAFAPRSWGASFLSANDVPDFDCEDWASLYMRNVGSARQAYENHAGRKILLRYEDLRVDTLDTMKRIYSSLEIAVDEERLANAVAKHSWEAIPEDQKGQGKFYRRASPGGWKDDLTAEEVQTVETLTAPSSESSTRESFPTGSEHGSAAPCARQKGHDVVSGRFDRGVGFDDQLGARRRLVGSSTPVSPLRIPSRARA